MDWRVTVTNLFKKAEDPATTREEREALTEKAAYLMSKYGITELLEQTTSAAPPEVTTITLNLTNPYKAHRALLIQQIARAMGARGIRTGDKIVVFGLPDDIKRFSMLFASLWIQANLSLASSEKPDYVHGKTHSYNYLLGFVNEVNARVWRAAQRAQTEAKQEAPSKALVLANRSTSVNDAVSAMFPKLVKSRVLHSTSYGSYVSGVDAGRSADIGQQRVGRSTIPRKALS